MDRFQEIIHDLSEEIGISLYVDKNRACKLAFNEEIELQLQMDTMDETLLIGCLVCEIPPGRYRENVLKEAMRCNDLPYPRFGNLGYVPRNNSLALFDLIPAKSIKGKELADYLAVFVDKGLAWKNAVLGNQAAPQQYLPQKTSTKPPMFR